MIPLLIAGGVSLLVSLVGTRYLIDWLIAHQVGQPIQEDGPQGHVTKAGTPTMGGVAFVVAALFGYLAAHVRSGLVFTRTGLIVMGTIAGAYIIALIPRVLFFYDVSQFYQQLLQGIVLLAAVGLGAIGVLRARNRLDKV